MKQHNTTQPVLADKSIAQKIEKITQGLVGRLGVAAQELIDDSFKHRTNG